MLGSKVLPSQTQTCASRVHITQHAVLCSPWPQIFSVERSYKRALQFPCLPTYTSFFARKLGDWHEGGLTCLLLARQKELCLKCLQTSPAVLLCKSTPWPDIQTQIWDSAAPAQPAIHSLLSKGSLHLCKMSSRCDYIAFGFGASLFVKALGASLILCYILRICRVKWDSVHLIKSHLQVLVSLM